MTRKKYAAVFLIFAVMLLIIFDPVVYASAAYDGLILYAVKVLPVLFPFFFFTKLLTATGVADGFSEFLKKPVKFLYNAPPVSAYVFVMSALSGYPVGAKLLADLYERGAVTTDDCKRITSFTSTAGPMFIIGTVGGFMLRDKNFGYVILLSHLSAALLNGLIYRKKSSDAVLPVSSPLPQNCNNILSETIESSVIGVLIVGGYIAIFNMLAVMLKNVGAFGFLAAPVEFFLNALNVSVSGEVEAFLTALVEMTRGAAELSKLNLSGARTGALLSAVVSFGGLSVAAQSVTCLSKCGVSASHYLKTKATQCMIAGAIGFLTGGIFFGF